MQASTAAVPGAESRVAGKVLAKRPLVLFVAAEHGSRWNDSPGGARGVEEHVSLVAQCPDESAIRILPRTIRQLSAVEASGRRVSRAAILMNERHDEETMSTRRLVVLALSRHARTIGSSIRITLCGDGAGGPEYRRKITDLLDLARADSEQEPGTARIHVDLE